MAAASAENTPGAAQGLQGKDIEIVTAMLAAR
jgi:hypothetical protein